ncbi:MAG TPA: TatD family hydrolase [Candidatus Sulfotelmatobacter sp.]|nr:TatD family hydrolase [Candidatus Sulfotelmatobacter sp.]
MIDSHAHPYMSEFDGDRDAMLRRAAEAGVRVIVAIGYDLDSSRQAIRLAAAHSHIFACVAIHPHHADEATPAGLEQLRSLAAQPRVVGIGETGLDFYRNLSPRNVQEVAFRAQLRLARDLALPVVVHDRDAHAETLALLEKEEAGALPAVVLHCFSGDAAMARTAAGRRYYLGAAGPLTYRNASTLRAAFKEAPADRLLLETDAPYLPPEPHRGHRNESAYLPLIAEALAAARGVEPNEIADLTAANARRAFRLPGEAA